MSTSPQLSMPTSFDGERSGRPRSRPTTRRDPLRALDLNTCRSLMRGGSKSFFAASLLLPGRVRAPATALYAFCRVADDAVDLAPDPVNAAAALTDRLQQIYANSPLPMVADRAMAAVVHRFHIPAALPEALIEGFTWDAQGRQYDSIEALHDYGARVAGSVGAMMALIMGVRSGSALASACELGVAMQLTNIARDVGEDARNGRLYLPRAWMREAQLDPDAWLRRPVFDAALASVVARLLAEADRLYVRAEQGIAQLPRDCRPAIFSARHVYAEIGRQLATLGFNSVANRAVVPGSRKLVLMARSALSIAAPLRSATSAPSVVPLAAIRYLVEAAAPMASLRHAEPALAELSFYERSVRVVELFERVMHRNRLAADASAGAMAQAGGEH